MRKQAIFYLAILAMGAAWAAQQLIDLGPAPNTSPADSLRTGGQKINENFTEVYSNITQIQTDIAVSTNITLFNSDQFELGSGIQNIRDGALVTNLVYSDLTTNTAVYLDASKRLRSSSITRNEMETLLGVDTSQSVQNQLNARVASTNGTARNFSLATIQSNKVVISDQWTARLTNSTIDADAMATALGGYDVNSGSIETRLGIAGLGGLPTVTNLQALVDYPQVDQVEFVALISTNTLDHVTGLFTKRDYTEHNLTNDSTLFRSAINTNKLWVKFSDGDLTPEVAINLATDYSAVAAEDIGQVIRHDGTNFYNGAANIIDLAAYGVVGDGITDDTVQIQAALDDVSGTTNRLYVPPGTYLLSTNLVMDDNTTIIGAPDGSSILKRNFSSGKPFGTIRNFTALELPTNDYTQLNFDTNIVIRNIGFDSGVSQGPHLVLFGVRDGLIDNCWFQGDNSQDWALSLLVENFQINNNTITNTGAVFQDGIHLIGGTDVLIAGNQIHSGDDAIAFGGVWDNGLTNVLAINNRVFSTDGHGLRIVQERTQHQITPTNNIENIVVQGLVGEAGVDKNALIYLEDRFASTNWNERFIRNVSISGVTLEAGDYHTQGLPWGVYIVGTRNVTMTDVHARSHNRSGFRLESVENITLNGVSAVTPMETAAGYRSFDATVVTNLTIANSRFENSNTNQTVALIDKAQNVKIVNTSFLDSDSAGNALAFTDTRFASVIGCMLNGDGNGLNINDNENSDIFSSGLSFGDNLTANISGITVPTNSVHLNGDAVFVQAPGFQDVLRLVRSDGTADMGISFPNSRTHIRVANKYFLVADNVLTDNTARQAFHGIPHYDINEQPVMTMFPNISSGQNDLHIGGASGSLNAMETVSIWTAPDDTTTTGTQSFRVLHLTGAGQTRMQIYDVDNAGLQTVTVGAADSGGAGFKLLRIPN